MDLINEDDRARSVLPAPFGLCHYLLDLFDPHQHCREFDELRFGHMRDDLRQRGFPGTWRSPEDE